MSNLFLTRIRALQRSKCCNYVPRLSIDRKPGKIIGEAWTRKIQKSFGLMIVMIGSKDNPLGFLCALR